MKKVFLRGPILTQSGYGHHARTVLRALTSRKDLFDIYVQPISWGSTSWIWKDDEERKYIDDLLKKTISYMSTGGKFDISLQVTIPNEWEKIAPINIGVTAGIETTKVSPQWIEKSYLMDKIITISSHSKWSYENTKYDGANEKGERTIIKAKGPIEYVSYPVRRFEPEDIDFSLQTDFNFLTVAQLSPRKNINQLVKCFVEKFKDDADVGLIIKANTAKNSLIDKRHTVSAFKRALEQHNDRKCKIYLLHGYLSDEEMAGLYSHPKVKCYVTATHGEGFGLPIFEAAYYGLPVVATDWSGHLDFLYKPVKQKNGKIKKKHMFSRISYTLGPVQKQAVWDGILIKESQWAYPEEGSIKMNLEEVHKDYGRFHKRAKDLQKWICKEFNEEKMTKEFIKFLEEYTLDEDENKFAFFERENNA
jgi:glycosyltransferase involved in cell wall biosynthesis